MGKTSYSEAWINQCEKIQQKDYILFNIVILSTSAKISEILIMDFLHTFFNVRISVILLKDCCFSFQSILIGVHVTTHTNKTT